MSEGLSTCTGVVQAGRTPRPGPPTKREHHEDHCGRAVRRPARFRLPLTALSRSTHFDWGLGGGPTTSPRQGHAQSFSTPDWLTDDQRDGCWRSGQPGRGPRRRWIRTVGHRRGTARPRLERGADRPGSRRVVAARAGRSRKRPGGHAVPGCGWRVRSGGGRGHAGPCRRTGRPAAAHPAQNHAGKTRPCRSAQRSCWPTIYSRTPIRCCARSDRIATRRDAPRMSRMVLGRCRLVAGAGPGCDPEHSVSRRPPTTPSTPTRPGFRAQRRRFLLRMDRVDMSGSPRTSHLGSTEFGYVTFTTRVDRQLDHAAEEEPRHRRGGSRQVGRLIGNLAGGCSRRLRLSRWPITGPAGKQGTRVDSVAQLGACCAGDGDLVSSLRFNRRADAALAPPATRSPPMSPNGCAPGCSVSSDAHEAAGAASRWPRSSASGSKS